MRGAVTIVQAVIIFAIVTSAAALALPWAYKSINRSLDLSEMDKVRMEFALCNDKLVETARTGSPNKCFFSIRRGNLYAQRTGIYYKLVTKSDICDRHWWKIIDEEKHLWQRCEAEGLTKVYYLNWYWPKDIKIEGQNIGGDVRVEDVDLDEDLSITFDDTVTFLTLLVNVEFDYVEGQVGSVMEIERAGLEQDKAILSVNIK